MRYVKGHGLQTRRRIVEHASYGLRQRGADGLSVVDLMKLVGLSTRTSHRATERSRTGLRRRSTAASGAAPINTCDRENRDHD
jgi:TetR/AcrR family transcriptional regulator, transcriptional repressor for nem operon